MKVSRCWIFATWKTSKNRLDIDAKGGDRLIDSHSYVKSDVYIGGSNSSELSVAQ